MKALDLKLVRDIIRIRGQALAIMLVIASGVATFVLLIGTMDSLRMTRDAFYADFGFADVFSQLKRCPEGVRERIAEIPGVNAVDTRVGADIRLDIAGFDEPVTARVVSVPSEGPEILNRIYLRKGRIVDPQKDDEVVVSEAFAEAHKLQPGDGFAAVINGRWKKLVICGVALSPEFVLQSRPGAISPDYKRYAILWMGRRALESAYDMKGAFNEVSLSLSRGAEPKDVIARLDDLLSGYGGLGAYERKDQLSNRFLTEEFRQLQRSAQIFPTIFIAVSAFLLNIAINRVISLQREQISILKAFGYSNLEIGLHYAKMVLLITVAGIASGIGLGVWLGRGLAGIYMEFYRFPYMVFELRPAVVFIASAITVLASLGGALHAVRRSVTLAPAEGMRPEPPALYGRTLIEKMGFGRFISQPARIILRNLERSPVKTALTIVGISMSCAIMVAGTFSKDAVDFMVDVQFRHSQKEDLSVTFTGPASPKALYELRGMNGVGLVEGFRYVPVRLRNGYRTFRTAIRGMQRGGILSILPDVNLAPVEIPSSGVLLTDHLGGMLGVKAGDMITVETLEGKRIVKEVPVAGLVKQYVGVTAYMEIDALNRLMGEGDSVTGAYITVDSSQRAAVMGRLSESPLVAGTVVRLDEMKNFYDTQAEALLFFTMISTLLAGTIAFGVVYNSARISLSERSREMAGLRVLGYTRAEISYILLGELAFLTLAAIPPGFLAGGAICAYIAHSLSSELFRVPLVIGRQTYALAATVVVVSACVSGLMVRRRLDGLDLIGVLKTRE